MHEEEILTFLWSSTTFKVCPLKSFIFIVWIDMWFFLGVNTIKLDVSSCESCLRDKEDVEGWASLLVIYSTFDGRPPVEIGLHPSSRPTTQLLAFKATVSWELLAWKESVCYLTFIHQHLKSKAIWRTSIFEQSKSIY